MIDLSYAFRQVVTALEEISANYLVVGSTAAAAWGSLDQLGMLTSSP